MVEGEVCQKTGLKIIPASWQTSFRVQGVSHPPISAPERESGGDPTSWNRFDIPGQTVYLADRALCAYQEVLAQFKRKLGAIDPLLKEAQALGMSLEEFYEAVASDWEERHFMHSGTLPRTWRETRMLHVVSLPRHGWWVEIEDPESISSLEATIPDVLLACGLTALDISHLRSQNRILTTAIAQHVAAQRLFDGSLPLGIVFGSRHGAGTNYAVWKRWKHRPVLEGPTAVPGLVAAFTEEADSMEVLASSPISYRDPDLETAARLFGLTVF